MAVAVAGPQIVEQLVELGGGSKRLGHMLDAVTINEVLVNVEGVHSCSRVDRGPFEG